MKLKLLTTSIVLLALGCTQENETLENHDSLIKLRVIDDYVSINSAASLTPLLQRMAGM